MKNEVLDLTELQEVFLNDLRTHHAMVISMETLYKKYADITYKTAIKREIEQLVGMGIITRKIMKTNYKGRFISKVMYKLK